MTPTTDCDILETIADALTSKFKKELIANLKPYAECIRDGEKYQRVIKQLLETLPEYVELRDKYDSLLQENERLKSSSTTTQTSSPPFSQDNIVLDLTEPITSSEVRKVDLTNNIHMVCQTDENTVVNKVEQEEQEEQVEEEYEEESEDEEESEEEPEEEQSKPESKECTIVKREDHPEI